MQQSIQASVRTRYKPVQAQFGPRTAIMGERRHQTYGPDDIVRWLNGIHPAQLPWRDFTLN